jgi:hypothetical protein
MSDLFNTGIRPKIDEYLLKKSKEERNYGKYWSASSAGYCMRLNIMRRLGVPKVPELEDNATQTRIFEAGHIFHEWLQRITKDAGLSIASEVELQDEDLMIRGHFDDLVLVPSLELVESDNAADIVNAPTSKLILYDYKTAHSASFNYKKQRTEMGHYHKMQLGTYMYMLKNTQIPELVSVLEDTPNLNEARILSISKDDLRMHEEQLLWTPDLEKEVVSYWKTLNGYWAKKTLPKCTCLDHDGGFLGKRSSKGKIYNDYMYTDPKTGIEEQCSTTWMIKTKEDGLWGKDD